MSENDSLYVVPLGMEFYLPNPDPAIHTRIKGPQPEKISEFADYMVGAAGIEGVYWADRAVSMSEYLNDPSIVYLMTAGFLRACRQSDETNVFKLEYFRPVNVNKVVKDGGLYVWPALGVMDKPPGPDDKFEFEPENDARDVFAECMGIPREAITLLSPLMERRLLPFWKEEMYKSSLEQSLWKNKNAEIYSVLPPDYFILSSWPRYLPVPPEIIESKLPSRDIFVPDDLDASIYRKLENAGWVVIKKKRPGNGKYARTK